MNKLGKYKHFMKHSALVFMVLIVSGCYQKGVPVKGFVLPDGDIDAGQEVFSSIGCQTCHSVADLVLAPPKVPAVLNIELGGEVLRVKSYGELLTSIVNPDHTILAKNRLKLPPDAKDLPHSPMPDFNDGMTVAELIDLTSFLHSRYEKLDPHYRGYYYGP